MEDYLERWLTYEGIRFLKDVGLREGNIVLDFGSGIGYYTIPAAIIVGENGRIYAIDREKDVIDRLMEKARKMNLNNIKPMVTDGIDRNIKNESLDVVLLYDVLHDYYFTKEERTKLLEEIYRVLKYNGLVSVYPKHMNYQEIILELEKTGFHFGDKLFKKLIHYYLYENGLILNFYKIIDK